MLQTFINKSSEFHWKKHLDIGVFFRHVGARSSVQPAFLAKLLWLLLFGVYVCNMYLIIWSTLEINFDKRYSDFGDDFVNFPYLSCPVWLCIHSSSIPRDRGITFYSNNGKWLFYLFFGNYMGMYTHIHRIYIAGVSNFNCIYVWYFCWFNLSTFDHEVIIVAPKFT